MRRLALLSAVLLALVGSGCTERDRPARIGSAAPAIAAPSIVDGQRVSTSDLEGSGYLVNFWGSWCEPCKRELPRLAAAERSGTRIVGVAVKSSNRLAREQLQAAGASWNSATDPEGAIAARWGVASGFPVTVAVDSTGRVRAKHIGELSDADIAKLAALVK